MFYSLMSVSLLLHTQEYLTNKLHNAQSDN